MQVQVGKTINYNKHQKTISKIQTVLFKEIVPAGGDNYDGRPNAYLLPIFWQTLKDHPQFLFNPTSRTLSASSKTKN